MIMEILSEIRAILFYVTVCLLIKSLQICYEYALEISTLTKAVAIAYFLWETFFHKINMLDKIYLNQPASDRIPV